MPPYYGLQEYCIVVAKSRRRSFSLSMHDLIGWLRQIPLQFLLVLAVVPVSVILRLRKPLADRRRSHVAENWPTVEGCIIYAHVDNAVLENSPENFCAYFSYYFSLNSNGETEYYSGEFSHIFSDEEPAQEWIDSLKEKKIPIRIKPGNPNISIVLFDDLISKFPLPIPAVLDGRLEISGIESRQPFVLRLPTEMMASLTALGFCIALLDHLFRVLSDRPVYPKLAIALWIGFAVLAVPFEIWSNWRSAGHSFDLLKKRSKKPLYLRIVTWVLNLYVASNWIIDGTRFAEYFHLHRERIDPMWNGAFLALLLGNYAAFLYNRLENIEESPVSASSLLHPE